MACSSLTFASVASEIGLEESDLDALQEACSTEDFLSGTSSADLDLLQSVGLFQAVGVLFKASHAQGHLAGSAGVIGHGGLADREKRLLAIVQR